MGGDCGAPRDERCMPSGSSEETTLNRELRLAVWLGVTLKDLRWMRRDPWWARVIREYEEE